MAKNTVAKKRPEPASISYVFGPGYKDMKDVIQRICDQAVQLMRSDSAKHLQRIQNVGNNGPVMRTLKLPLFYIYWVGSVASVMVASIYFLTCMIIPHVVLYAIWQVVGITGNAIVRGLDFILVKIRRLSIVCDACHNRYTLPIFLCGNCNKPHFRLVPNQYGALHHKCECGTKLPSSYLVAGRSKLRSLCPYCYEIGREEEVTAEVARTILIPVVGGESAGKTALITAFAHDLVDKRSPLANVNVDFESTVKETMFGTLRSDYQTGTVRKTATITRADASSTIAHGFFLSGPKLGKRLLQVYDIAGETFVANNENEFQKQYGHANGVILALDPMSLPKVRASFGAELNQADAATISSATPEDVLFALQQNFMAVAGKNRNRKSNIPLAVVLTKVDESVSLQRRISLQAGQKLVNARPEEFSDPADAMDFLCRQFLMDMDLPDLLQYVDQNFTKVRFFAGSAIGHSAANGQAFNPDEADMPWEWIVRLTDNALADVLNMRKFSNAKLPIAPVALGRSDEYAADLGY